MSNAPSSVSPAAAGPHASRRRVILALALGGVLALRGQPAPPNAPVERDLNQPIVIASSEVFFPYQFRDRDGQLKGFANDVTDAVVRVMNLHARRVMVANSEMGDALRTGGVDVIQFWSETDARRAWADFSVPVVGGIETVAVVRKADRRIRQLADLDGKRVAVGQKGTVGWNYLVTEHPTATPVFTETSEQFLRMISAGQLDAAVMSRLTAASMIDRYGLNNLKVLEDRIPGGKYDVRYCFTVRKGDSLLLARLNEGLAILHRTGEYDRIYHHWFGRFEAKTFRPVEVVSYVAAALALGCIAATWGFLRQRQLSRRIARQAQELAEQRSLLAALHEKHPLATVIFEVSPDDAVEPKPVLVSANDEAVRLFHLDRALVLPRALEEITLAPGSRSYLDDAIQRGRRPGLSRQWEARLATTQQMLESAVVPLGHGESGAQRLCVLSNDVTARRLMDQEVAQSRRLRALGELVGGIAHEFNNLLTPVMLTTSLARMDPTLGPEMGSHLKVIDDATRRAAEITQRLLTFGRRADDAAKPVRIAAVVENCFGLLRPTMDRRIEWLCTVPANLKPILFNPTDLNQVMFNLVINARDALLEKLARPADAGWTPRLMVSVEELPLDATSASCPSRSPVQAWQRITVADNGVGIAPEIIERIFEPFFTTKEIGRGTGLGLATVWHLVTEAGGNITVESKLDVGTKIHVWLPRVECVPAALAVEPAHAPAMTGHALRVLLVEDEDLVAQATVAVLERNGHIVSRAGDGAEAWATISERSSDFDLLLADVNMPRMSGVDLVRRVRESAFRGRIVIVGGRVSDEERRILQTLRVDRILNKPFTAAALMETVREVFQSAGNANAAA